MSFSIPKNFEASRQSFRIFFQQTINIVDFAVAELVQSSSAFSVFFVAASASYHDATPQLFQVNACFLSSLLSCCPLSSSSSYFHYPFFSLKIGLTLNHYFFAFIFKIICLPILRFLQTLHRF